MSFQLELFEEITEDYLLKKEIEHLKDAQGNLRRGLFARHGELVKLVMKQQEEIEDLRRLLIR